MKTQDVNYNVDGKNYKSFVAYTDDTDAQKPVVMVLPEWWGLTDYAKDRAKKLFEKAKKIWKYPPGYQRKNINDFLISKSLIIIDC